MTLFSHLIVEQIPGLRRYARALTGGKKENADDLVQDTLERAYVKWHLFRLGTHLRPWLFSIMHNVFIDEARLLKHRVTISSVDDELTRDTLTRSVAASQENHVQVRQTLTAVGQLPPDLREVLVLVTVEEFSYAQAAKILDVPVGTVMSRLSRARAQLRILTGAPALDHPRSVLRLVE